MNLQKAADSITNFMGTWKFVSGFFVFLMIWITFNLTSMSFDRYPFILLNLFLSCFAAITMPVIMISQKKQDKKADEQEQMMLQQQKTLIDLARAQSEQLKILIKDKKQ